MEHQYCYDRISAYLDNELKHEEHAIIEAHINSCEECQKHLAELKQLNDFIDAHDKLSDDSYWEESARKIEQQISTPLIDETSPSKESSSNGLWWKFAGVAASIALVAFISLYEKDLTDNIPPVQTDEKTIEQDSVVTIRGGRANEIKIVRDDFAKDADQEIKADKEIRAEKEEVDEVDNFVELEELSDISVPSETPQPTAAIVLEESVNLQKSVPSELQNWFNTRDSLLVQLAPPAKSKKQSKRATQPLATSESLPSPTYLTELKLLEAYFNIAQLSSDSLDYNQSLDAIINFMNRSDTVGQSAINYYNLLNDNK